MSTLLHMFNYTFIIRAFIVGLLISLCAAMLGVNLVLRKNAMISDGLSHVSFGSFAIATVLGVAPLYLAVPVAIIAAVAILKLNNNHHIHGDGAIAVLSSSSLAIGIMAISLTSGVNTDINNYLFGSILSLNNQDMIISIVLSLVVLVLYVFSYHKMFALTFDEDFAKSTGINRGILQYHYCDTLLIDDCTWYAYDGRIAYLEFDYFSMSYFHVFLQGFQACCDFICHSFFYLFYYWFIYFLSLCSTNRCLNCDCESRCFMYHAVDT